jgi:hypothetical protein
MVLIHMHTYTYLHRSFVPSASLSSSSSSSYSALSSLSSGTSSSVLDDKQPKVHDPPLVQVVTQATADDSFAGYVTVQISVSGRRAKTTETGVLGFVVNATLSQAVCEVPVNAGVKVVDANDVFRVTAESQELTQVLAAQSATLVIEASGQGLRYLHTWSCWQGLPTEVKTQSFNIVPTPSVVVSFSIEGVNSVEEISKEVRESIVSSFSQAFGVPAESVYIEGLIPDSVRRSDELPLHMANDTLTYTGQFTTQRKHEGLSKGSLKNLKHIAQVLKANTILHGAIKQQQERVGPTPMHPALLSGPKRRLLAVTISVKILTTSQSQADSLAKAVTPSVLAGLIGTLAQQGLKIEASSLSTVVVAPKYDKNTSNSSQAVLGLRNEEVDTHNGSINVAVIAGSTGAGFFLFLCILGFLVWSRVDKSWQHAVLQQTSMQESSDVNPFLWVNQQDTAPFNDASKPEGTRSFFEPQQQPHQERIFTSGGSSDIVPDENDTICVDDIPFGIGTKNDNATKSSDAGSVFQPISASNSNIELRYVKAFCTCLVQCVCVQDCDMGIAHVVQRRCTLHACAMHTCLCHAMCRMRSIKFTNTGSL